MAKISLRSYIQEIEGLIDHGQTDEAIAHCKHILRYYPKHIDTYRMLGKAYLESQRYSEAADVLHRVLSVYPDDFVSQIGMSIIREDEGNLDAAIWHMERTFEVQPANTAVQDELRRLYGRRDGVEPPKVRLTRGALARLYARGELYPQAIAEVRAALADDPERVDLEVILAQTYFASGQKVEATETCSRLVNKLPFCFEANRLLTEILPGTTRAEDTKTYQQRIFALDPYAAYTSPNAPTNSQVPDNAVTLDHLDWQPPQDNSQQQPEWAKTVGIDLGETEEALPDWLTPMPAAPASPSEEESSKEISSTNLVGNSISPDTKETENSSPSEDQVIPDWMKTAGWATSSGTEAEEPSVPAGKFEEEIAAADIPDWLQSFAPTDGPGQEPQSSEEQEKLEILDKILPPQSAEAANPQTTPETSTPVEIQAGEDQGILQPETPSSEPVEAFSAFDAQAAPAEGLPDWLQGLDMNENFKGAEDNEKQPIPEWMQSINEPADNITSQPSESAMPDWLSDLTVEEKRPKDEISTTSEELPEWMKPTSSEEPVLHIPAEQINAVSQIEVHPETPETTQEPVATAPNLPGDDVDAAMAWLESLAAKQGADQGTLTSSPDERMETPPAWVQREMENNVSGSFQTPPAEIQPEQVLEETVVVSQPAEQLESKISEPEVPLTEPVGGQEPATLPQPTEQKEPAFSETEPTVTQAIGSEETEIVSQPIEQIEPLASEIAAPSIEAINAEETPKVEEVEPAQITETAPVLETVIAEELVPAVADLRTEITPESVTGNVEEISQTSIESQPLSAPSEEPQQFEIEKKPEAFTEAVESAEPVIQEQTPVAEESQEETPVSEAPQEATPIMPDMSADDGFAWLEALAAKQGADEGTLSVAPKDRSEIPPAWVSQAKTAPLEEIPVSDRVPDENLEYLPDTNFEPVSQKPESLGIGLPDWLKSADFIEQEETFETSLQKEESRDSSLPEWLKEIEAEETPSETAAPNIEESTAQPIPEWLQKVNTEPEIPTPSEELQPVEEKDLPDWLENLENKPAEPAVVPLEENTIVQPEPLPEWLQGLDETGSHTIETTPEIGKTEEVPVWVNELDNLSVEEGKPGATKPLTFPSDLQPVEQVGGFEIKPESSAKPEFIQSEEEVPAATAKLSEISEPSIPAVDNDTMLSEAQAALDKGKLKEALAAYNQLISSGSLLDEAIHDLRDALYRYPVDIGLWQALGDAYVRGNHLQDALDAYTKAEELLR